MKKLIFSTIVLSIMALAAVLSTSNFSSTENNLLMENIEALAQREGGDILIPCSVEVDWDPSGWWHVHCKQCMDALGFHREVGSCLGK